MGMNQTPASERIHISFFGKRNAGKSSIINAITGQDLAIVSDVKGTTTDPVYKTMELLPLGPVMIIDTPGIDDEGELGALRVKKSFQVLNKTDIAVLVTDIHIGKTRCEEELILRFQEKISPGSWFIIRQILLLKRKLFPLLILSKVILTLLLLPAKALLRLPRNPEKQMKSM
jgi:GTPase_EngA: ribosome-associated GTPase EngA